MQSAVLLEGTARRQRRWRQATTMAMRYGEAQPVHEGGREGGGRCELSWRGWAMWRGHMIYSRGLIAVSLFPFVLILFSSVLILFPFARCHVCWCMQTCNVYMDSTIIFYFLFCKHAIFNQRDKSWAFLFSFAPFLSLLVR